MLYVNVIVDLSITDIMACEELLSYLIMFYLFFVVWVGSVWNKGQ